MSDAFDPYYIWLGIPPEDQPPNHYRLLGVTLFESNREVIEAAANRQMAYMQEVSSGDEHIDEAQNILGEFSKVRICLLNTDKKAAYDAELRASLDTLNEAPEETADDPLIPPQFGLPDDEAGAATEAPTVAQTTNRPHTSGKSKKKESFGPIIGLAVVFLILLVGGIAFLLSSRAEKLERERTVEIVKKEADRKAEQEVDRKAKQEADRKTKEENARRLRQAERKAKDKAETERNAKNKTREKVLTQLDDDHKITSSENNETVLEWPDLQELNKLLEDSGEKTQEAAENLSIAYRKTDEAHKKLSGNESGVTKLIEKLNANQTEDEEAFRLAQLPPLPDWVPQKLATQKAKKELEQLGWQELEPTEDQTNSQWYSPRHVELQTEISQFNEARKDQRPQTLLYIFQKHKDLKAFKPDEDENTLLKSINGDVGSLQLPKTIQETKTDLVEKYRAIIEDSKFSLNADNRWEHTLANNSSGKKDKRKKPKKAPPQLASLNDTEQKLLFDKLRRETFDNYKAKATGGFNVRDPNFIRLYSLIIRIGKKQGNDVIVNFGNARSYPLPLPANAIANPNITIEGELQSLINRDWEKWQAEKQSQEKDDKTRQLTTIEKKIRDAIVKVLLDNENREALNFLVATEDQWLAAPPWASAEPFDKLKPKPDRTKRSEVEFKELFEQGKNKKYTHNEQDYLKSQLKQAKDKDIDQLLALYLTFDEVNSKMTKYTGWRINGAEVNLTPIKPSDTKKYLNSIIEKMKIK